MIGARASGNRPVMNSRSVNLALWGLNLGFLGVIGYLLYLIKISPVPVNYITKTELVTNKVTQIAVRKVNATNYLASLLNRPLNWSALESTNYAIYIANLRSFGCPDETIEDIVLTDIAKLYAKRRAELRAQLPQPRYWQADTWEDTSPPYQEVRRQLRELDDEQRALVKELLGVDFQAEMTKYLGGEENQQTQYDFLPPAKRGQISDLLRKYDEMESDFYSRTRGLMLPQDEAELRKLQKQREDELASVLTADELLEYQLRNSATAQNLRAQLGEFNPTEAEFRKIFQLQKSFDDTFSQNPDLDDSASDDARARAQREARKALDDEIKSTLGETRYAQYQRAQDSDYRTLAALTERFELSPDVAGKVYDMKQAAEKQKRRIEEDPNLTEDQRWAALLAVAKETQKSVSQALGDQVFKNYQKAGGNWLKRLGNIAPPPAAALPAEEDFAQ